MWTHSYPARKGDNYHGGGSLSTPVFDGDRVYALSREGRFFCFAAADGAIIWQKELMEEFGLELPTWMFAASPLVLGENVIVNVGTVLSLNKDTGATVWKSTNSGHAYSTPRLMTAHGREHLLVFNGNGLAVLNPADGNQTAFYSWTNEAVVNAATPVVIGDRIFISSGYNRGCAMLRLTEEGLESVWESKVMRNHMSGCVLFDGHLYGFDDATLKCLDPDGNERWRKRGLGKGALMVADGKLIVLSSKGELIVADASPGGFAELTRTKVLDGGVCWTMPILANGLIYCRNSLGDIVCRDHRPSGG